VAYSRHFSQECVHCTGSLGHKKLDIRDWTHCATVITNMLYDSWTLLFVHFQVCSSLNHPQGPHHPHHCVMHYIDLFLKRANRRCRCREVCLQSTQE